MYEKRNLFEHKRESKSKENSISFRCQKQFLLAQGNDRQMGGNQQQAKSQRRISKHEINKKKIAIPIQTMTVIWYLCDSCFYIYLNDGNIYQNRRSSSIEEERHVERQKELKETTVEKCSFLNVRKASVCYVLVKR